MGRSTDLERDIADDPASHLGDGSSLVDEAALFASPLPMVGKERTTTRKELWVSQIKSPHICPS